MRTKSGEKEKLRNEILAAAVPFLKKWGRGQAPVDKIMEQAGLTSGALYSHFKSKDDLFAQAIGHELERVKNLYAKSIQEEGAKGLKALVERYLSPEHVSGVEEGCVFGALGADMHRSKPAVRAIYEQKILEVFEALAPGFTSGTKVEKLAKAKVLFSSMLGSLLFARCMKNPEAGVEFLNATKKQLLATI